MLVFQHFLHITHHFCLSFVTTHPTHGMVIVKGMLCWHIISCTNKKEKKRTGSKTDPSEIPDVSTADVEEYFPMRKPIV